MNELLDMNAIAKLDSAIVGGLLREEFLASLKHWNIFNGLGAGTDSVAFVDWLLLRGITVRVLHPVQQRRFNRLLIEQRHDDVARAVLYKRIVTVHPLVRSAPALSDYADLLNDRGEIAEADVMYQRALAVDPDHVSTLCNYGILLDKRGENVKAEAMFQRGLSIDPNHACSLCNYGVLLYKRGDFAAAEAMYQRVLAIDPDDVTTLRNYGILLDKRGDFAAAKAMYQGVYQRVLAIASQYDY